MSRDVVPAPRQGEAAPRLRERVYVLRERVYILREREYIYYRGRRVAPQAGPSGGESPRIVPCPPGRARQLPGRSRAVLQP